MVLKEIFKKPVDRSIEGVIKADDEAGLRLEIEEYVLTKEVTRRIETFLDAYNNYDGANGVWISGFFGSGKSHLLKMLALLLENREIDDVKALDLFLPKCSDNELLRGDLKRAVTIPSRSILFNIDQKADVISKAQIDALLAVFVKVFDEHCGYYGKQGHIAQFERDLDSRSLYQAFKTEYKQVTGIDWEKGREQALLESRNIAKAYSTATNTAESDAVGILDKYRSQYRVSIEDFANKVKEYIDRQLPSFRLNFFVDEVGQYIAENVKLMTNLQTIAESLATKCRGHAWIVVTSQNDMTTVLGEMNRQQSNDFSKIMARFATKMLLTSTNVAEVIQERLLSKTDDGAEITSDLYHKEFNNFGTLFRFTDGSRDYKVYKGREDFVRCYPFIPYQFELFQSAIENLSRHNAFEGKHSSVGERSMLGVFQQVAIQISDFEINRIASFDLMFEGIQTALKSQTQKAILAAKRQLSDDFAIKILKALFLVKYVKEFKPTLRNICILMQQKFGEDLQQLQTRVEEALNYLEQQTFIQRSGECYEYLTDEEKDVEEEIKNTEVETDDVIEELEKIVFQSVIENKKIRFDENKQDYPFSRKLDDQLHGREYELAIHIISPFHEHTGKHDLLKMQNMGKDELMVVMPANDRIVRDLLMYKRTENYVRQTNSITQQETIKRILQDKAHQNGERYRDARNSVYALLSKAKLFVSGNEFEITSEDPQLRITRGFHELINRIYPNLRMLKGVVYTENDLATCLSQATDGMFGNDAVNLSEPEQEMLAHVQSNNRSGLRTTLKNVMEKFERKPYGWYFAAILCTLAKLWARAKVEVRADSNILDGIDLERALLNTHGNANVIIDPQIDFTAAQIRNLKEFYTDFFDSPPVNSEAKALAKETAEAFKLLNQDIATLAARETEYPFCAVLKPHITTFNEVSKKPYDWYLLELVKESEKLLDIKESVLDPIRQFMSGNLRDIYNCARNLVQAQKHNFPYIDSNEASAIESALGDPECYRGNRMQQLKALVDSMQRRIDTTLYEEISKANQTVDTLKNRLQSMQEFTSLTDGQKSNIIAHFDTVSDSLQQQKLVAVIRDNVRRFEEDHYPDLLSLLSGDSSGDAGEPQDNTTGTPFPKQNENPNASVTEEPRIEYVNCRTVRIPFDKPWLADESDIDRYLAVLKSEYLKVIGSGKRVQI